MAKTLTFTPEEWMLNADGSKRSPDDFERAMNEHYREKYAGLSRPIIGGEVFEMEDPNWALQNLIQEYGITMIHGSPGSGKSLMAMDWAYVLAHPELRGWMGQKRGRQYKPMYIFTEGRTGLPLRSKAWEKQYGTHIPTDSDGVVWVTDAVRLNRSDDPEQPWSSQVAALFQIFNDNECDILFIDTLANTFGGNENSQQDANDYLAAVRMFVNAGAPVVIVHHNTKEGKDYRGSTVFEGAVDTKVSVEQTKGGLIHLYITKQKDGDPGFHLNLRLNVHEWQGRSGRELSSVAMQMAEAVDQLTTKQRNLLHVVASLGDDATSKTIADNIGSSAQAVNQFLKRLETAGLVERGDDMIWRTTLEEL